jgi:AAA+ ATPase superfamily predicted ATPase
MMFQVGKPVTGSQLIGREEEINKIEQYLKMGQSVVIIAPRRYGKTSLLLEILRRRKENNQFSFFTDVFATQDIFSLAADITKGVLSNKKKLEFSINQLKNHVVDLMRNIQFRQEVEGYEFILGFGQKNTDEWEMLAESLKMINQFAEKHNQVLLGVFDEFGDIEKLDGNKIVKLFRAELQLQQNSVFLFAGSYETMMNKIFISSSAPFYRFARIIRLGNISKKVFVDYLTPYLEMENIPDAESWVQQIADFTNGHPYYTPFMTQQLIFGFSVTTGSVSNFNELIDNSVDAENDYFERIWTEISANRQEKVVILALAEVNNNLYSRLDAKKINISRTVKRLSGSGHIQTQ